MNTITTAPIADWLDPGQMAIDPYPTYSRLRDMGPVVYAPALNRFVITTHEAVSGSEQRPDLFSSSLTTNLTMVRALGSAPMLRKDDPDHERERSAINPTLRPRQVNSVWSPRFEQTVQYWLDRLAEIGPDDADLNRDFAAPVASQNLIDLIGFPTDVTVGSMHRWSTDYIAGIGNIHDDPDVWTRCANSQAEVNEVLDELLPRLRREPDSSVTSHLLQVGLDDDAVRANVHLTISGGMNEPQHVITNMVWAFSTHPGQAEMVRSGQIDWGSAFEETVRWISPIGMAPRETTAETEWAGVVLPARANVGLLFACANRDETVFAHADRFDVRRNARGHLGFGAGSHMCAGRWAAKAAVGEKALPALYKRFPQLRADETRQAKWHGWVFRGLTHLPVTW